MKFVTLLNILFFLLLTTKAFASNTAPIIKAFLNGKEINQNCIVYIDSSPSIPKLNAVFTGTDKKVIWKLKALFNRPNRTQKHKYLITHTGSGNWDISKYINPEYIGGTIIISASSNNAPPKYFTFNIRANNPSEDEVLKYIGNNPKFAKAIAVHEAGKQNGRILCQFNEVGKLGENYIVNIKHTPNRGSDMLGWGIFQITNPVPTHTDLWNWKANVDKGKKILSNKKRMAQEYFTAVKRTYPNEYETPPQNFTIPGTNIKLTALEAATIQLYNGGAVEKSLKNSEGTFSAYVSCWEFLPDNPRGQRWKFTPNRNNYIKKVALAYEDINNKK